MEIYWQVRDIKPLGKSIGQWYIPHGVNLVPFSTFYTQATMVRFSTGLEECNSGLGRDVNWLGYIFGTQELEFYLWYHMVNWTVLGMPQTPKWNSAQYWWLMWFAQTNLWNSLVKTTKKTGFLVFQRYWNSWVQEMIAYILTISFLLVAPMKNILGHKGIVPTTKQVVCIGAPVLCFFMN